MLRVLTAACGVLCVSAWGYAQVGAQQGYTVKSGELQARIDKVSGALDSLMDRTDPYGTNFVAGPGEHPEFQVAGSHWLGDLDLKLRVRGGAWQKLSTDSPGVEHIVTAGGGEVTIRCPTLVGGMVALRESYVAEKSALRWSFTIRNTSGQPVEIGSLGLPLLFNTMYAKEPAVTYGKRVVRHSYIEGDDSFVLVTRANGEGPFLLMTPLRGTRLEYYDVARKDAAGTQKVFAPRDAWEGLFTAFVHAKAEVNAAERTRWRQPLTSRTLEPGAEAGYGFRFEFVPGYPAAKQALVRRGLLDVETSPGMVLPSDLEGLLSLRSAGRVTAVRAEYPAETRIDVLPDAPGSGQRYRLQFSHLGENELFLTYGGGQTTQLEYFVTLPLEILVKKRAAFLVAHQQVRDPGKWYDGLFSLWDMRAEALRTPDSTGGIQPYMVSGSDDPDLSKAPYIAQKNLAYPDREEIAAVEYYIEHFVWGKLQRTDKDRPYPYGIYGSTSWFENRNSLVGYDSGGNGREHMWRTFDYPHMIQLYFTMYQIARLYPNMVHYATAEEYLQRAYGTALAYFTVPYSIRMGKPWGFHGYTDWAVKQGAFHEVYILDLLQALGKEGKFEEEKALRNLWNQKALYFLYDHPYPFGSEMYFDTTAFESTHAIAKYALSQLDTLQATPWYDKNTGLTHEHHGVDRTKALEFMRKEILANVAARGYLETSYYQLGSDIRQGGNSSYLLSYMTQMGGWPLVDDGLGAQVGVGGALNLGYASYLAGWADVNAGNDSSGYGAFFPGAANDGAAGWGFNPLLHGISFVQGLNDLPRGLWPYDGEIDNGFSGAFRSARSVVFRHAEFGWIAVGGGLRESGDSWRLRCRDGLNQRIDVLTGTRKLSLTLDRDGFDPEGQQILRKDFAGFTLQLRNRAGDEHQTELHVAGLPAGSYAVRVDGQAQPGVRAGEAGIIMVPIQLGPGAVHSVELGSKLDVNPRER